MNRATARHLAGHERGKFYFCSESCLRRFEADPEAHRGDRSAPESVPEGTKYTCPMHPEVVRGEFGNCPLCGMALQPMGVPRGRQEGAR